MKTLAQKQQSTEPMFYLQDSRALLGSVMMFWRAGDGYTSDLEQAELFTKDQAESQYESRRTDVPWPAEYLNSKTHPAIDCQLLDKGRARFSDEVPDEEPCVLMVNRKWDGNSIFFQTEKGAPSKNLDEARIYKASEVRGMDADNGPSGSLRPLVLSELRKIQFMVVNSVDCKKSMNAAPKRKAPYL